jgi:hexosaminidase
MLNKLNVMHWHITDDEAFPWLLKYFTQITKTGAYSDKLIYTATDIAHIIDYANSRGV